MQVKTKETQVSSETLDMVHLWNFAHFMKSTCVILEQGNAGKKGRTLGGWWALVLVPLWCQKTVDWTPVKTASCPVHTNKSVSILMKHFRTVWAALKYMSTHISTWIIQKFFKVSLNRLSNAFAQEQSNSNNYAQMYKHTEGNLVRGVSMPEAE